MEKKLYATLKKYWGYDTFRPKQCEIIRSILAGRDTLALMPTGGGKSLTYQIPALLSEGLCIVVTPLIALMKDQVDSLRRKGIAAVAIHAGMGSRQVTNTLDNCAYGDVKFLYIAPERLSSDIFRMRLADMNVALVAVDEAHCISQWGYDFRPSYLRIAEIRSIHPTAPILALTASATERVAQDIMVRLNFAEPNTIRTSFSRPNLTYVVRHVEDKSEHLLRIIGSVEGQGIVYVRTREAAEQVAQMLQNEALSATFYHGGLPSEERNIRQDEWVSGKVRIMVATNAFGMGIDKSDVRFVIHYTMCDSLESYYQEAGRAGRDGRRSYAVLLVGPKDNSMIRRRFERSFPKIEFVKSVYEKVCNQLQVAIGDGKHCAHLFNLHELCRNEHLYPLDVSSALELLQQNGYLTYTDQVDSPSRLIITVQPSQLYGIKLPPREEAVLQVIMRQYPGIFTDMKAIDEMEIAHLSRLSLEEVSEALKQLRRMHVVGYIISARSPMIYFDEERLPTSDIYITPETYTRRKELMHERFDQMLRYAENESECRSMIIENYFGDTHSEPCGVCDLCIARRKAEGSIPPLAHNYREQILSLLASEPMTPKRLAEAISGNDDDITAEICRLTDEGIVEARDLSGKLSIKKR
ncbi:MAG: RecQ family ATP-dependent DNA helicase [Alistipes sp.]|nr:RecQ family ATP-dependent DNA helicase [Alistipes sp.]